MRPGPDSTGLVKVKSWQALSMMVELEQGTLENDWTSDQAQQGKTEGNDMAG